MSIPQPFPGVDGKIGFNTRLLELARHNGFEIELTVPQLRHLPLRVVGWRVPPALRAIVGNDLALVENPHVG